MVGHLDGRVSAVYVEMTRGVTEGAEVSGVSAPLNLKKKDGETSRLQRRIPCKTAKSLLICSYIRLDLLCYQDIST